MRNREPRPHGRENSVPELARGIETLWKLRIDRVSMAPTMSLLPPGKKDQDERFKGVDRGDIWNGPTAQKKNLLGWNK